MNKIYETLARNSSIRAKFVSLEAENRLMEIMTQGAEPKNMDKLCRRFNENESVISDLNEQLDNIREEFVVEVQKIDGEDDRKNLWFALVGDNDLCRDTTHDIDGLFSAP